MIVLEIGKLYEIYNPDGYAITIFKQRKGEAYHHQLVSGDIVVPLEVQGYQYRVLYKNIIGWIDCDEAWKQFAFKRI